MNATQMINILTFCEVDSSLAADCRAVLMQERIAVQAAAKSGDGAKIAAAMAEAQRVAKMWGVTL